MESPEHGAQQLNQRRYLCVSYYHVTITVVAQCKCSLVRRREQTVVFLPGGGNGKKKQKRTEANQNDWETMNDGSGCTSVLPVGCRPFGCVPQKFSWPHAQSIEQHAELQTVQLQVINDVVGRIGGEEQWQHPRFLFYTGDLVNDCCPRLPTPQLVPLRVKLNSGEVFLTGVLSTPVPVRVSRQDYGAVLVHRCSRYIVRGQTGVGPGL